MAVPTVEALVAAFPGLKDVACDRRTMVEAKLAEASSYVDAAAYGSNAQTMILRWARWLLHVDGCSFASAEQAEAFKAHLDAATLSIGCRVL